MTGKETPDPQVLEALTENFSKRGWNKEVPGMLSKWARQEGIKFECAEDTFHLEIENEDGRITQVSLLYPNHILINREGMGSEFKIESHPVLMINAVNPENIERDVESGLVIKVERGEGALIVIKKSGEISGKLKQLQYASGEE